MQVLVAGGSRFIGRHLVEFLLAEGHEVTLFNRGRTNPGLFPEAREIAGDRAEPPAELGKHDWDWVFDLSCYTPEAAESLVRTVGPRTGRYVLCSTISVYDWDGTDTPTQEDAKCIAYTPKNISESAHPAVAYGAKKRAAEETVFGLAPETGMQATIVRPSLVYGPWDPTDRWHWWLHRVKEGKVVVPRGAHVVQPVYVKDLARIFMAAAKAIDADRRIYNGTATYRPSIMDWVRTAAKVLGADPVIREVDGAELKAAGVEGLPGLTDPADWAISSARIQRDFGFTSTPFAQTIAESLDHMAREGRPIKEAIPLDVLAKFI